MKFRIVLLMSLSILLVTACGRSISEEISEAVAEQVIGVDNLEIDDEQGLSFTTTDEDGNEVVVSIGSDEQLTAIEGFGLSLPLPAGTVTEGVQRFENADSGSVTATVNLQGIPLEEFAAQMDETLLAQGFVRQGDWVANSNEEQAQFTSVSYKHTEGYLFTLLGSEEGMIVSLIKEEGQTVLDENGQEIALPTTLDGTMSVAGSTYASGEEIVVSLSLNTPLAEDAWVGIVPADTPHGFESDSDAVDISYRYVRDVVDGQITLNAPTEAGSYDVRLFNTDGSGGVELASHTFEVSE